MKRLSLYLFLILFTLPTPSQANDIRDFQIEGMSVGDNALDYFTEDELENSPKSYYPNKKFHLVDIFSSKYQTYDSVQFSLKNNDYKFYSISGTLYFRDKSFKKCLAKKEDIQKEIFSLFKDIKKIDRDTVKHPGDKSGKSKVLQTEIIFSETSEVISIQCTYWSKEIEKKHGWVDNLSITLYSAEYANWLRNEAYK